MLIHLSILYQLSAEKARPNVVGVNKYRLSNEDEQSERVDVLKIDNTEVRKKQIQRLSWS